MIWCETDEENGETADDINDETWEEFSQFSKENFRFLTFSEFDSFEKTAVFYLEQNVPEYKDKFERDFIPLNFLSSLFINTKKGKKKKVCSSKTVLMKLLPYMIHGQLVEDNVFVGSYEKKQRNL